MAIHLGGVTVVLFVFCPESMLAAWALPGLFSVHLSASSGPAVAFPVVVVYIEGYVALLKGDKSLPPYYFYPKAAWNFSQMASSRSGTTVPY